MASYLRQPGSARAFSRTVRDVIRWRGQTRNLFDRIAEVSELPPMRLFWGARDTILPILQGTTISALLENCDLISFENCGHFAHWEEPEAFVSALRAYLDAPDAPPIGLRKSAPAPDQVLCGSEKNGSVSAY
jgi:pimeloyl-ACP methyl ester carboxylesterase